MAKRILSILAAACLLVGIGAFALIGGAAEPEAVTPYEDFEGISAVGESKIWEVYGGDHSRLSLVGSDSDYLISGEQSLLVSVTDGGDISLGGFGNNDEFRIKPDEKFTVRMKLKFVGDLPADLGLMLQVMSWSDGNWGDEIWLHVVDGKLTYNKTVGGPALTSKLVPTFSIEDLGNNTYQLTATHYGVATTDNAAFYRLRRIAGSTSVFSVDDICVSTAKLDGTEPIFSESFDYVTDFNEWGGLVGANGGMNFPRGAGTNAFHELATVANKSGLLISGAKSLIVNKPADNTVESVAVGNVDGLRFDPAKRYVLTFKMKADGALPVGSVMKVCLMNWSGTDPDFGHYSNELRFTQGENGITVDTSVAGDMLEGAIKLKDGVYYVVAAFNGMNSNNGGAYDSFVRAIFEGGAYTVSLDDWMIAETDAAVDAFLPEDAPVTTTTTEETTTTTTEEETTTTTEEVTTTTEEVTTTTVAEETTTTVEEVTTTTTEEVTTTTTAVELDYSALGNPFYVEDFERSTGVVDGPAVAIPGTAFNWPFGGGEKYLRVATGDDAINGTKSLILSTIGETASGFATMNPAEMFLAGGFVDGESYVMSYILDVSDLKADGKLSMVIRTWDFADSWPVLSFTKDGNGGLKAEFTEKKQDTNAVVVKKLDTDLFHVAVRFKGVESNTECYPFWELTPGSAVVFDDVAVYQSAGDPALALQADKADDESNDNNQGGNDDEGGENVDTGVSAIPAVIGAIVMGASACGLVISRKKRK